MKARVSRPERKQLEGLEEITFNEEYLPLEVGCSYQSKGRKSEDKVTGLERRGEGVLVTYRPKNAMQTGIGHIDLAVSLEDFVKSHEMIRYDDFDN